MDNRLCRNLYRVDEACASFRHALISGKKDASLFWADELFSSGCIGELNQILFEVWTFFKGPSDVEWLLLWYGSSHDYNSVLSNTVRLCWSMRDGIDSSVFKEMILLSSPLGQLAPKQTKVLQILRQLDQKVAGAFSKLKTPMQKRAYRPINANDLEFPCELLTVQRASIYGLTERGQMSETTTTLWEVRGDIVETLWGQGTPYWSQAFAGYDGMDDDAVEAFYKKHFPTDIPDEWSLERQMRTHGPGCLFVSEKGASIVKLLRSLYRGCEGMEKVFGIFEGACLREEARTLFDIV
jgi:hypothetical protein